MPIRQRRLPAQTFTTQSTVLSRGGVSIRFTLLAMGWDYQANRFVVTIRKEVVTDDLVNVLTSETVRLIVENVGQLVEEDFTIDEQTQEETINSTTEIEAEITAASDTLDTEITGQSVLNFLLPTMVQAFNDYINSL